MKNVHTLFLLFALTLVAACQSDRRNAPRQEAQHLYARALESLDRDSASEGETLLRQAIRQGRREGDLHTVYLSQLRLAECLSWGDAAGALQMAREALLTYERRPDNARNYIIILDYIATYASQQAYNDDQPLDTALQYAHRAHRLAQEAADTLGHGLESQTLTTLANIHWAMEHYTDALGYAREGARLATPDIRLGAQQVLARCLVSCDSLDEAERVYHEMDTGADLQAAYIVQSNLAKLALRRSDTEAAETAIDEAFGHAEDLYFQALGQKEAYYRTTLAHEQENERMRYQSRLHLIAMVASLVLLLLLAYIALRELRQRRRESLLHWREAEAQREKLRQRDATVAFLKDFILQRSEVVQKLNAGNDQHIALSDREWSEVERTLNAIDGDRFERLRDLHPELRDDDLRLCILTRLHLSNRAIGNVYGISISAVQHRKLKLKKETFSESDPDTTLEQVLERI